MCFKRRKKKQKQKCVLVYGEYGAYYDVSDKLFSIHLIFGAKDKYLDAFANINRLNSRVFTLFALFAIQIIVLWITSE